jgi:predicted small secreted protein
MPASPAGEDASDIAEDGMALAGLSARHASYVEIGKFHRHLRKETSMLAKFVLLLSALSFASITLTACNTVQGAGKDVERAGQKVQEEAQEHKKY